jgi:hypothetical protein
MSGEQNTDLPRRGYRRNPLSLPVDGLPHLINPGLTTFLPPQEVILC